MNKVAVAGIHTDIGKTVASAVLCEALQADYWKPVQAGGLNNTDSNTVRKLVSNGKTVIHPEAYRLSQPMSPHAAAAIDGVKIEFDKITMPPTDNILLIETAGGLMSPLNNTQTNLDLIVHFNLPVILVSQNYLGSINHTLLTIEVLKAKNIKISFILFNGQENTETQKYILQYSRLPSAGRINYRRNLDRDAVAIEAQNLRQELKKLFKG